MAHKVAERKILSVLLSSNSSEQKISVPFRPDLFIVRQLSYACVDGKDNTSVIVTTNLGSVGVLGSFQKNQSVAPQTVFDFHDNVNSNYLFQIKSDETTLGAAFNGVFHILLEFIREEPEKQINKISNGKDIGNTYIPNSKIDDSRPKEIARR